MARIVYKPNGKVEGIEIGRTVFCLDNLHDAKFFMKIAKKYGTPHTLMRAIFQKYNGVQRFKQYYKKYPLISIQKKHHGIDIVFYKPDKDGKPVEKHRMS